MIDSYTKQVRSTRRGWMVAKPLPGRELKSTLRKDASTFESDSDHPLANSGYHLVMPVKHLSIGRSTDNVNLHNFIYADLSYSFVCRWASSWRADYYYVKSHPAVTDASRTIAGIDVRSALEYVVYKRNLVGDTRIFEDCMVNGDGWLVYSYHNTNVRSSKKLIPILTWYSHKEFCTVFGTGIGIKHLLTEAHMQADYPDHEKDDEATTAAELNVLRSTVEALVEQNQQLQATVSELTAKLQQQPQKLPELDHDDVKVKTATCYYQCVQELRSIIENRSHALGDQLKSTSEHVNNLVSGQLIDEEVIRGTDSQLGETVVSIAKLIAAIRHYENI